MACIEKDLEPLQKAMTYVLRVGVILSTVVITFGAIFYLLQEGDKVTDYRVFTGVPLNLTTLKGILEGFLHFNSKATMQFGFLTLILATLTRVLIAFYVFVRKHNYLYLLTSLFVFLILLYGLLSHIIF